MSREETPVLAGTLPAFEMFMSAWERLAENHPRLGPFIEIGLHWARKYYCRMDQTRAYIVAMGQFYGLCRIPLLIVVSSQSICPYGMDPEKLGT
jgi:hypothetical protein